MFGPLKLKTFEHISWVETVFTNHCPVWRQLPRNAKKRKKKKALSYPCLLWDINYFLTACTYLTRPSVVFFFSALCEKLFCHTQEICVVTQHTLTRTRFHSFGRTLNLWFVLNSEGWLSVIIIGTWRIIRTICKDEDRQKLQELLKQRNVTNKATHLARLIADCLEQSLEKLKPPSTGLEFPTILSLPLIQCTVMIRFSARGPYLLLVPQGRALIRDRALI